MDEYTLTANKAADLIARRGHFAGELKQKLLRKGCPLDAVERVIEDFIKKGYLNDPENAGSYIKELQRKNYGYHEIIRRLQARGVDESSARNMLKGFYIDIDETKSIRAILKKKSYNLADIKDRRKAYDFLMRRGFDTESIRREFREFEDNEA
ncbi:MAG: regulatory protein RecX [Oligoflexia bacterium]|nr:regulatory protein RecX [Oligoflexia bacterium]